MSMDIDRLLNRILRLLQHVEGCEGDCPEESLELADLVGKLNGLVMRGQLPERWRKPVEAAMKELAEHTVLAP